MLINDLMNQSTVLVASNDDISLWTKLWFREAGSTFAASSDAVYYFIFWVSALFFVPLIGLMVYFGIRYRRSVVGQVPEVSPAHNTALELAWSIVPTLLMAGMFYWGFQAYMKKLIAPDDAMEVYVTAKQWGWEFVYPDGAGFGQTEEIAAMDSPVIAFPAEVPVKMIMTSQDVIHSFYIPAFRIKRDIFPNRYTTLWFQSTDRTTHTFSDSDKMLVPLNEDRPGYYLFCAEYCGDQHSQMAARVAIVSDSDYNKWREQVSNTDDMPPIVLGEQLFKQNCKSCHSNDGTDGTGPTWAGLFGSTHPGLPNASPQWQNDFVVDETYIRDSILYPNNYLAQNRVGMVSYLGKFDERDLQSLLIYIKSLGVDGMKDAAERESREMFQREQEAREAEGGTEANATPESNTTLSSAG